MNVECAWMNYYNIKVIQMKDSYMVVYCENRMIKKGNKKMGIGKKVMYTMGRGQFRNLQEGLEREWLLTNSTVPLSNRNIS